VERIDISGLLPLDPKGEEREKLEHDGNIFSTVPIRHIAEAFLVNTPGGRLSIAGDSLYIAMTLANYDGRERQIHYQNGQRTVTSYMDQRCFLWHLAPAESETTKAPVVEAKGEGFLWRLQRPWELLRSTRGKKDRTAEALPEEIHLDTVVCIELLNSQGAVLSDSRVGWEDVRETAIALGAFPVAFPPTKIRRFLNEFVGYDFPSRYILLSNENQRLAGSQFSHFGGFFSQTFREFDYQMGRIAAQRCLKEQLSGDFGRIPLDAGTARVVQLREHYRAESHGV
jgi:hypothetical protein